MQRHVALQPLSREHHQALVLARRCERAADEGAREAARSLWHALWTGILKHHFALEEEHLLGIVGADLGRQLVQQHEELREATRSLLGSAGALHRAGRLLREHVRWEERLLFPWIEERAGEALLAALVVPLAEGASASFCVQPERSQPGLLQPQRPEPALRIERLNASRRADFERLHASACGTQGCHCVAWWVPSWEEWPEHSAADRRALRAELFERGVSDGYLAYLEDEPVGWCQAGPRDAWSKLRADFDLREDPGTCAVTCFLIRPEHRRQGLARRLLKAVVVDLLARGARRIEAYPRQAATGADELWNGPPSLFAELGFRPTDRASSRRRVVVLEREPGDTENRAPRGSSPP